MTKQMILTRGLPASGKTTFAKKKVAEDPQFVRLNRDDFRYMLYGKYLLDSEGETTVTIAQHGAIENVLKYGSGKVIIDDTNLNPRSVRALLKLAQKHEAEVIYQDFIDVDLSVCIHRDNVRQLLRERFVGEEVIRKMEARWIKGRKDLPKIELPTYELKPYVEREEGYRTFHKKPWAVIVDIDGTIAKMVDRGPYDWKRVGEDEPVKDVLAAVRAMYECGYYILFISGRDGSCYEETNAWLEEHFTRYGGWKLLMRIEKDNRPDWIVKAEIFDQQIRDNYNIRCVFDDRAQVVSMWRKLGLTVMQVAEGDF